MPPGLTVTKAEATVLDTLKLPESMIRTFPHGLLLSTACCDARKAKSCWEIPREPAAAR